MLIGSYRPRLGRSDASGVSTEAVIRTAEKFPFLHPPAIQFAVLWCAGSAAIGRLGDLLPQLINLGTSPLPGVVAEHEPR